MTSLKDEAQLLAKRQRTRRLTNRARSCVPISKWSSVFPDEPVPPSSQHGMESIDGQLQAVVYISREGKRAHVYDLSEEDAAGVVSTKKLAQVREEDDSDAEAVLEAREQRALLAMKVRAETGRRHQGLLRR